MTIRPPDLVGRWNLSRTVHNHLEATRILVAGTAEFVTTAPGRIDWIESGLMHLPGGDVPVTATRHLRQEPDGSWATDFADGRAFHRWDVGVELVHACSPDLYRGWLEVPDAAPGGISAWTMRWAAVGPAKDYLIESRYERLRG